MSAQLDQPAEMPGVCEECLTWHETLLPLWRGNEFRMRCRQCRAWCTAIVRARLAS